MEQLVILSKREQEHLLHAIESALNVREPRRFFLWTQGQFQSLLPHRIMVCLHFDGGDELQRIECLHGAVLDPAIQQQLSDLALRLARACRDGQRLPAMTEAGNAGAPALAPFRAELERLGLDNVMVHGTEQMAGGGSFFALFDMPHKPGPRHAYFLELLLPYLHMALLRLRGGDRAALRGRTPPSAPARPVSARETEILHWVREGKSNQEVGQILGISGLMVKNHLQRIFKTLGVCNRTQAVSRSVALRLLDRAPR